MAAGVKTTDAKGYDLLNVDSVLIFYLI